MTSPFSAEGVRELFWLVLDCWLGDEEIQLMKPLSTASHFSSTGLHKCVITSLRSLSNTKWIVGHRLFSHSAHLEDLPPYIVISRYNPCSTLLLSCPVQVLFLVVFYESACWYMLTVHWRGVVCRLNFKDGLVCLSQFRCGVPSKNHGSSARSDVDGTICLYSLCCCLQDISL